jgi:hypothetical protein
VVLESFRPVVKDTLHGFVRIRFDSGLIVDEVSTSVVTTAAHGPARQLVRGSMHKVPSCAIQQQLPVGGSKLNRADRA